MDKEQQRAAKERMVALMQAGHSWKEAATPADVQSSRASAYRLLQRVRLHGNAALHDGRHGHAAKLREPVLHWLRGYCQVNPHAPTYLVQQALEQRFGLHMNISHLNATRAALGLGSRARSFGEKNWMPPRGGPQWQTGAGGLLLVAAAQETGLFVALETALTACTPASHSRLKQLSISSRCMLLSTLLFLGVVGPTGCATR